jgi:hypothetical protein
MSVIVAIAWMMRPDPFDWSQQTLRSVDAEQCRQEHRIPYFDQDSEPALFIECM